jgi:hypothetical protein
LEHSRSRRSLLVPDHNDLKVFVKSARRVWREAHPQLRKRKGRPSDKQRILSAIGVVRLDHLSQKKKLTQGKLIKLVKARFERPRPDDDTIRKYNRLYHLIEQYGPILMRLSHAGASDIPLPDRWQWLTKKFSSVMKEIQKVQDACRAAIDAGQPMKRMQLQLHRPGSDGIPHLLGYYSYPEELYNDIHHAFLKLTGRPPLRDANTPPNARLILSSE